MKTSKINHRLQNLPSLELYMVGSLGLILKISQKFPQNGTRELESKTLFGN